MDGKRGAERWREVEGTWADVSLYVVPDSGFYSFDEDLRDSLRQRSLIREKGEEGGEEGKEVEGLYFKEGLELRSHRSFLL